MYRDIPEALRVLIEPAIEEAGYELVDLSLVRGKGPQQLRIVIDNAAGDGRIPVDDIAVVSREIGTLLDAADAIAVAYRLEVSSPGLDRVLARAKDFEAACGSQVKIQTAQPVEGRRRFKGTLSGFDGSTLEMLIDGEPVHIPFESVTKANVMYEFSSADFAAATSREMDAKNKVERCSA